MKKKNLSIITEFCLYGSLYNILHKKKYSIFLFSNILYIMKEICKGISYLYSKNIIHRDLKSHNILINQYNEPKICDFRLSKTKIASIKLTKGIIRTPNWMASEIMKGESYNEKCDIYSFGIIIWYYSTLLILAHKNLMSCNIWELITNEIPYKKIYLIYQQ